jgi:predicted ABC-type ATPase
MSRYAPSSTFNDKGEVVKAGPLTPERAALHDAIRHEYLDKVQPAVEHEMPVAILTMGGPASGKSSMLRKAGVDANKFVHVDADGIKGKFPEYKEGLEHSAKDAAAVVHEESSMLAKQVRDTAIEQRKSFIFDGTGANAANYEKMVDTLKGKGYHVRLLMTDLSPDAGVTRAAARAEREGRYVPESFIRATYSKVPESFQRVAQKIDDAALFDNHGKSPRAVWTKQGDVETSVDHAYFEKFKRGEPRGGSK